MTSRRRFLIRSALGFGALGIGALGRGAAVRAAVRRDDDAVGERAVGPFAVATWPFGAAACAEAWRVITAGGSALDAVEAGARQTEADPDNVSVGLGGLPDAEGRVTLDASVMTGEGDAGAVAALEGILHPVSVARRVMERTPHVLLAGDGAQRFAIAEGFPVQDLNTEKSRAAWRRWLAEEGRDAPAANREAHDTIGILARDAGGHLAGACSTSGAAFKLPGRVGDSPIVGAALFVDATAGAACATGLGEEVIRTAGSFLVVELMRGGLSPAAACRAAVQRIVRRNMRRGDLPETLQVGFLAFDVRGRIGAWAVRPGFSYAVHDAGGSRLRDAPDEL